MKHLVNTKRVTACGATRVSRKHVALRTGDAAAYREQRTKRSSHTRRVKFCRKAKDPLILKRRGKTAKEHCRRGRRKKSMSRNVEKRTVEKRWIDERIKRPECRNPHPSYPQISCISLDKYIFPNLPQIHSVCPEKCKTLTVTDRYGVGRMEEFKKRRSHCNVITTGF